MLVVGVAASMLGILAATAPAQVDCSDPDDLCTGDPCRIGEVEVLSPCVVDFGARDVVLTRTLKVPSGGVLSFTAANIEVSGKLLARHIGTGAAEGGDVSLAAADSIQVLKRIDASGRTAPGAIELTAGGDVILRAPIHASAKGKSPTASGGTVTVTTQGALTSTRRGRIKVKGKGSPGGTVSLSGASVDVDGKLDARGSTGGMALVAGSVGAVVIGDKIEVDGLASVGGTITVQGNGAVTTSGRLDADGRTAGGVVDVQGGVLTIDGNMQARGSGSAGAGGLVSVNGASVTTRNVAVRGRGDAGTFVASTSSGDLEVGGHVDLRSTNGAGGDVSLSSAGSVVLSRSVRSDGETGGGEIDVVANGGSATMSDRLLADGRSGPGGAISIAALTDVDFARGATASGSPGGTIVANAGGDLTAAGVFDAESGGCISLTATGMLLDSQASYSPANGPSCP